MYSTILSRRWVVLLSIAGLREGIFKQVSSNSIITWPTPELPCKGGIRLSSSINRGKREGDAIAKMISRKLGTDYLKETAPIFEQFPSW